MFISDLSIRRPVLASVMMLALLTLGVFSYLGLAIDMWPDVEIPVLSVVTIYKGAPPETVEKEVTNPIEEALNTLAGVKHVSSRSREGVSEVVVEFHLEVKINEASQEARAKIQAIRGNLPLDIETPVIQKIDFSAMPIVSLAVHSDNLSGRELTTLVEKRIKKQFETIRGVGRVDLVGALKREVSVEIDPLAIGALGLGIDEVIAGIESENINTPVGRLWRNSTEVPVRLQGKPTAVEQYASMVITHRNGRPITLGEVAHVYDSIEEQRSCALVNGSPAIALDIMKQSRANTVEVVEAVKRTSQSLQRQLPQGTRIDLVRDASIPIRESVSDVQHTLIIGGILTICIVFLFLNSWRSTVITGLTLPISVISSFIPMYFLGMTMNVMTLMALSLAIGLLIDDAIVVRENIVRHLQKGEDHFTAAREGTNEIGLAVLATTFSIVAVFVPVAFMKGIIGRFFFHFGITVAFAVLVSLLVSFTLDPMLSSRWHDPDIHRAGRRSGVGRLLDGFNRGFDRASAWYQVLIAWALNHRVTVIAIAVGAFVGGLFILGNLHTEFVPSADQGELQIIFTSAPDASFEETYGRLEAVLAAVQAAPEVHHNYATIGAGEAGTVRDGAVYVKLVDRDKRSRRQEEIQRELRQKLSQIPGIVPTIMEADRMDTRKPLLISVRGDDLDLLKNYARTIRAHISTIPGLVDIEMTLEHVTPEYRLTVDRQRAVDLGTSSGHIVRTLATLVGGRAVTTYEDEDGDAVQVRIRLPKELRKDVSQIENLRMAIPGTLTSTGPTASLIPLGSLVSYTVSGSPSEINRQDLRREVLVSANLDNLPLGTAIEKVKRITDQIPMAPGYHVVFGGEAESMSESFEYLRQSLILAVIFVYLILAAQFESFLDPLAIMLSLPLSIVGMALTLLLTGDSINIMSQIGLIMLMGLVTKNAILLVDFTKTLRSRGLSRRDALIHAGRIRLRPIMMTTSAMIFGMLPTALALGAGGEWRAPMGRAVIGGLITSTLLTLIVVPVVYTLLEDFGLWVRSLWQGQSRNNV